MFDKYSILGQTLQAGVSLTQQTGLQVLNTPKDVTKSAVKQIGGQNPAERGQNQLEQLKNLPKQSPDQKVEDAVLKQHNEQFVKDLYASSSDGLNARQNTPDMLQNSTNQKSVDEKQKLESLRKKLHDEVYYQPLINRPKTQEEVERPTEKVEREKMEDLQEKQKKEEEKPRAVHMAERKTEMFRGASG